MRRLGHTIRIEVAIGRFQLVAILLLGGALALAGVVVLWQFGQIPLDPRCTSVYESPPGLECAEVDILAWVSVTRMAESLQPVAAFLPWLMGILVGVPAVGAEIETRTATLAWTLTPSRRRWLTRRVATLLPIVLVAIIVPTVMLTVLAAAQKPLIDPLATFDRYQSGMIVSAGRAILAFGIALAVGSWLGRVLPAIIVSAAVSFLAVVLLNAAFPHLRPLDELTSSTGPAGMPVGIDNRWVLPDGTVAKDWATVVALAPDDPDTPAYDQFESALRRVSLGYPASAAVDVAAREATLAALLGIGAMGGALVITSRRRPY